MNKKTAVVEKYKYLWVWSLRVFVGVVFIYSGFVKTIDPWGFLFKLEEYFALADILPPRSITLLLALGCSMFEFISGVVLLVGSYRRLAPLLMALFMLVMLPLTAYLYIADPIEDCGCFGDAVILSNGATFFKNIILSAAIVLLVRYNNAVPGLLSRRLDWVVAGLAFLYSFTIGLFGYNVQPFIDFRPYPEGGKVISEGNGDSPLFVYTNGKITKEFTMDNLPEDESWEFVERRDSSPRRYADLSLYDSGSNDVLPEIIEENPTGFFLVVIPEPARADISGTFYVNELSALCREKGLGFYGAIATDEEGLEVWKDLALADYPLLTAEDTSLKEFARGTISMVYIRDGVIMWKRTVSSLSSENLAIAGKLDADEFPMSLTSDLKPLFVKITAAFISMLLVVFGVQVVLNLRNNVSARAGKS